MWRRLGLKLCASGCTLTSFNAQVCVADASNGPDLATSEGNEGVISLRRVSGQALTLERMLQVVVEASLP